MAECSYARCVQERRAIKKELQRWTRNMVFVVGLERIAEELMGRRKWRHYQESVLRSKPQRNLEPKSSDWQIEDKCCFCDGGMFLGPATSPHSDCGSSSNSRSSFHDTPPTTGAESSSPRPVMTTLESVTSLAASLAAVASYSSVPAQNHSRGHSAMATTPPAGLSIYPPVPQQRTPTGLFPPWYLSPIAPSQPEVKTEPDTPPAVVSLPASTPLSVASVASEQPLDLSAKAREEVGAPSTPPMPQPLGAANLSLDNRHIFKAKPRMSAVAGRRTYTEEELQAALRDIQSGKLGTRRAAVIYGIPRSTLRNKVYKLAMERERDAHLVVPSAEERDLSGGEDEKEVERALSRPICSVDDLVRSVLDGDALKALLEEVSAGHNRETSDSTSSPVFPQSSEQWHGLEQTALGPYIAQLLAAGNVQDSSHAESVGSLPKFPSPLLPELVRRMMLEEQQQQIMKLSSAPHLDANTSVTLNGATCNELQKLSENNINQASLKVQCSVTETDSDRSPTKTIDNEELTDSDAGTSTSRVATPPNVILRIPSFKPTTKNGVATPGNGSFPSSEVPFPTVGVPAFPGQESSHVLNSSSNNSNDSCSPPASNLVGKGIGASLRDVIAKSISQKFQGDFSLHQKLLLSTDEQPSPKRVRFTPPLSSSVSPCIMKYNNNNNNSSIDDRNKTSAGGKTSSNSSGKGTRPKRGKYRNYDRDSLVEAVRAVQRGEMSVHRAGSYYGVPHSTLEYKVKERHLMRPRKREPKQQQSDDTKRKDDSGTNVPRNPLSSTTMANDNLKTLPKSPKTVFNASASLSGAPNGLKISPLFDPSISLAAYANVSTAFPFWPGGFPALPVHDFGGVAPTGFPTNPEHFFAPQMIQHLQDESRSVPSTRNSPSVIPPLGKTAREMAASLYDGTGANGNFLDGIIRSSLEIGLPSSSPKEGSSSVAKMSNKALIDQLCRNSCVTLLPKAPTPLNFKDSGTSVNSSDEEQAQQQTGVHKTLESDSPAQPTIDLLNAAGLPQHDFKIESESATSVSEEKRTKDSVLPLSSSAGCVVEAAESSSLSSEHLRSSTNESACDSKTVQKAGDEVAKDLLHKHEGEQDLDEKANTKSTVVNS